ncbi:MAG: TIGR04141 family sporadically distributed protein [Fimbriimonadaceae bacterium]|nr:TIGR04141 family sporadically distributed protein [Fimbriimonadaceae bacterium]
MDVATFFRLKPRANVADSVSCISEKFGIPFNNEAIDVQDGDRVGRIFVFHKVARPDEPQWLEFIESVANTTFRNRSHKNVVHSALLLVEYKDSLFAVSFSHGHHAAKRLTIERRFGVVTAANSATTSEIREFGAYSHGVSSKSRTERRSKAGSLRVFDFPKFANRINKLAVKVDLERPFIIQGGTGVRLPAPTSVEALFNTLDLLESWWNGGKHAHDQIEELDKIWEEDDPDILSVLNAALENCIAQADTATISLWTPEDEVWNATGHELIIRTRSKGHIPLDIEYLLNAYNSYLPHVRESDQIILRSLYDDNKPHDRPIRELFCIELEPGHQIPERYIFEDNTWFGVKEGVLEGLRLDINRLIQQSEPISSTLALPHYIEEDSANGEDLYIRNAENDDIIGTHLRTFPMEGGVSRIEYSDMVSRHRALLHIKRGQSFGPVLKVCEQAIDAAEELRTNTHQREILTTAFSVIFGEQITIETNGTWVVGIVLILRRPELFLQTAGLRTLSCISEYAAQVTQAGFVPSLILVKDDSLRTARPLAS